MELFDKLGDTIVSVSKDATQKAKDLSESAKIRMEIRAKQEYRNKLYLEIGKLYYEAHKEDEEKEFKEQILLINDAQEVLEELKQRLGKLKGTVRCAQCGQDMPMEADYCWKCGTKLVKPKDEKKEEDTGDIEDIFEEEGEAVKTDGTEDVSEEVGSDTVVEAAAEAAGSDTVTEAVSEAASAETETEN